MYRGKGCSHDGGTDSQDSLPFGPVQRKDGEQSLEEGDVEDGEVEGHGQRDGVNEHRVVVEEEGEERLAGGQRVHGVQHLNDHKNRERNGRGRLGHVVAEHLAANLGELGRATVEVRLKA